MHVPYIKMHGTGNTILIVDRRADNSPPPDANTLRELGDDATGPGFDQLMWLGPANDNSSVASYRVFNADGSEVEQCGNGVRCVARYLAGIDDIDTEFTLQSPAGPIAARVDADGLVTVSMGTPIFEPDRIPFSAECAADTYGLTVGPEELVISAVSMGNPHAVLQVAELSAAPVSEIGPLLEHHERFPERTNVGFMQICDRQNIKLRVHERGVGETAACGTGACAAVGPTIGLAERRGIRATARRSSRGKLARRRCTCLAQGQRRIYQRRNERNMSTHPEVDYAGEELSEQAVHDYLTAHPDFFENHASLLNSLNLEPATCHWRRSVTGRATNFSASPERHQAQKATQRADQRGARQ